MRKAKAFLVVLAIAFIAYSCAVSCGPGPGQNRGPATYPNGYTLEKQSKEGASK